MASKFRQIALGANDIKKQVVTSTHWFDDNGVAFTAEARSLSIAAKTEVTKSVTDDEGNIDTLHLAAVMLIASLHDRDTGERIFEDADRDALLQKSAPAVEEIWDTVGLLNGFTVQAVAAAEKNSEATPS